MVVLLDVARWTYHPFFLRRYQKAFDRNPVWKILLDPYFKEKVEKHRPVGAG